MNKELVAAILMFAGIVLVAFAQITGLGVALYNWAHIMTIGPAAWSGFVVWMKMMALGVPTLIAGLLTREM